VRVVIVCQRQGPEELVSRLRMLGHVVVEDRMLSAAELLRLPIRQRV